MKKTRLKRKSKTPLAKAKLKLWEICKQLVRKRDGSICVICGKENLTGSNWHTGHLIPSASCGGYLRYDLRNLHSNCYHCNVNLGGNGAEYYRVVKDYYGEDFVERIFKDKNKTIKLDLEYVNDLIEKYTKLLDKTPEELLEYTKAYGREKKDK